MVRRHVNTKSLVQRTPRPTRQRLAGSEIPMEGSPAAGPQVPLSDPRGAKTAGSGRVLRVNRRGAALPKRRPSTPNRGLWDSLGALDERTRRTARRGTETQENLGETAAGARRPRAPRTGPGRDAAALIRQAPAQHDRPGRSLSRAGRGRDRGGRRARNARTGTGYPRDANHPIPGRSRCAAAHVCVRRSPGRN